MKNIKQNKGFTTADIVVAVIIITIFVAIIANVFYNYYLTSSAKNRNAIATNLIIDILETAKSMKYEDISQESIEAQIENQSIPKEYTVTAELSKYNEIEGNYAKEDLIKILKVKVEYRLADKTEKIEISTLLTK